MAKKAFLKDSKSNETPKKRFTKRTPTGEVSREKIYEGAFRLFLSKPYETVTVTDLEEITGKSRGAIFYHIKDMRELFEIVIQKYIIDVQSIGGQLSNLAKDLTLLEFIDLYISIREKIVKNAYDVIKVDHNNNTSNSECLHLALLLSAGTHIDGYNEKMYNNMLQGRSIWSSIIQKAIEKGEVKPDINAKLFGEVFWSIFFGKVFSESFGKGIDTKEVKELFMQVYNQIKV